MSAPMPPGTYLRLRREAAGLSLEDVALLTSSCPHVPAHRRAEWLADVEAGGQPLTVDVALALSAAARDRVLPFDPRVLSTLVSVADGANLDVPAICTGCGCSWHDACRPDGWLGCSWESLNWCTACAGHTAVPAPTPVIIGLDLARGSDMTGGVAA